MLTWDFFKTSLFILGHHGSAGQHPAGRGGLAARGHRLVQQPGGRQALRLAHQEGGLNLEAGELVVELELVLVDTSLPDLDRYIDQELIEAGRAVPLTSSSEASDN